ncbi:S-layer homology domain-containing protein [Paenibacillus chartarius]|uniref:S-layer homology domain-containing protein n=1 Tax=Paenibacillus chartarius TaxID=747481 RepID=A0ABV6DSK5_9BACL
MRLRAKAILSHVLIAALLGGLIPKAAADTTIPLSEEEQALLSKMVAQNLNVTSAVYGQAQQAAVLEAPVLDPLPAVGNKKSLLIKGSAAVGASIQVYRIEGEQRIVAANTVTDEEGRFTATVTLADEGAYRFAAAATLDFLAFSPLSETVQTELDTIPPDRPTNGTWVMPEPGIIALQWSPPSGEAVDKYIVSRNGIKLAETGETFYQDYTQEPGAFYRYKIYGVDAAGNGTDYYSLQIAAGIPEHELNRLNPVTHGADVLQAIVSGNGVYTAIAESAAVEEEQQKQWLHLVNLQTSAKEPVFEASAEAETIKDITISENGDVLAFTAGTDGKTGALYVYDRAAKLLKPVPGAESGVMKAQTLLDGSAVLFVQSGVGGTPDLYRYERAQDRVTKLPRPEPWDQTVNEFAFSANGSMFAYSHEYDDGYRNALYAYDLDNGATEKISDDSLRPVLSSDGRYMMYVGDGVELYDLVSHSNAELQEGSGEDDYVPMQVSDDGKQAVFSIRDLFDEDGKNRLVLMNVEEGSKLGLGNPATLKGKASMTKDGETILYVDQDTSKRSGGRFPTAAYKYCLTDCQSAPPEDKLIVDVFWMADSYSARQASLGEHVAVRMEGASGSEVSMDVVYQEVSPDSEVRTERTKRVAMTESAPGTYRAELLLEEGMAEITSVRVTATKDGRTADQTASHLPLQVSGKLNVKLEAPAGAKLEGANVHAWSTARYSGRSAVLDAAGQASLALAAASDYHVLVQGPDGQRWADTSSHALQVRQGLTAEVSLPVRIPALLQATVKNDQNRPIPGAVITIRDRGSSERLAAIMTNEDGYASIPVGYIGQEVLVEVRNPGLYEHPEPRSVTLAQTNPLTWQAGIAKAPVSGLVTDEQGRPAKNVTVIVTQPGFRDTAVTGEDGMYAMQAAIGPVHIEAAQEMSPFWVTAQAEPMTIPREGVVKNLQVSSKGQAEVAFELWVKEVGVEWRSIEMNPLLASSNSYRLSLMRAQTDGSGWSPVASQTRDNKLLFEARSGEQIRLCASGVYQQFATACQELTLSEERKAETELRLAEFGEVRGTIVTEGERPWYQTVIAYRLDAAGKTVGSGMSFSGASPFRWNFPESGRYLITVHTTYLNGKRSVLHREIEVEAGESTDIGQLTVQPPGRFAGVEGNALHMVTNEAAKGGTVSLRGTFLVQGAPPVENAELLLSVPSGATLQEASVTLDGVPAQAIKQSDSLYTIPLGDIAPGRSGVVTYRLKLDENMEADAVQASLDIRYGPAAARITETIGTVTAPIIGTTLDAPASINSLSLVVSGRAPANSRVLVYDQEQLLGETQSSPGGYWKLEITLKDKVLQPLHGLEAKSIEADGTELISKERIVEYDPTAPQPALLRINGRAADLQQGAPRVVVRPGLMYFVLDFEHPERVKDARLHVGQHEVGLSPRKEGGLIGMLNTSNGLGSVYLDYDVAPRPFAPPEATYEEMRASLPKAFQEMKTELEPARAADPKTGTVYSPKAVITSPSMPQVRMETELSVTPAPDFVPEPLPDGAPPIYNLKVNRSIQGSSMKLEIDAYTTVEELGPELKTAMNAKASLKGVRLHIQENIFNYYDLYDTITSAIDYKDQLQDLEDLMNEIEGIDCLPQSRIPYYDKALVNLADHYLGNLVWNYTGTLTGIAFAASGFGIVAGLVVTAVTFAVSYAQKQQIEKEYEKLKADIEADKKAAAADPECKKEPKDKSEEPERPDRLPPGLPICYPIYIYDPSGYVYETVPSNRIFGATATVFQQNPEDGQWMPWNAEWFGQVNPQTTNGEGKYGWDVPEGWWKVRYEKEGYETAWSRELEVLPPHFDVNVPLLSRAAPEVESVYAVEQGGKLQVNFSKYMMPETLQADSFALTRTVNGAEQPIAVQVEPWRVEKDPQNREWARAVLLTPAAPFTPGEKVRVRIDTAPASYAEVQLGSPYDAEVEINVNLPVPPDAVGEAEAIPAADALMVQWSDEAAPLEKVRVYWKMKDGGAAEQMSGDLEKGLRSYAITGLQPDTEYELRIVTVDQHGTESPGVRTTGRTLKELQLAADREPPGEVQAASVAVKNRKLELSWTDPSELDFAEVLVHVKRPGAADYEEPVRVPKGTSSYTTAELANGRYELKLTAADIRGNESAGVSLSAVVSTGGTDSGDGNSGSGGGGGGGGVPQENSQNDPTVEFIDAAAGGGTWKLFDDSLRLTLPQGALAGGVKLKVRKDKEAAVPSGSGMTKASASFIVGSEAQAELLKPLTIGIRYDADAVRGQDARKLGLYRLEGSGNGKRWVYAGGVVLLEQGFVESAVTGFGTYAVMLYDRSFADLQGHWSKAEVELLASRHMIDGTSGERFEPDRGITRAEAAKLLLGRLEPAGSGGSGALPLPFRDVPAEAWYAPYVRRAAELGLIEGADGLFRPDDRVTREELAVLMYRAAHGTKQPPQTDDILGSFADADTVAAWARPAVAFAVREGWMQGTGGGKLQPQEGATRAQTAALLLRVLDSMEKISR